MPNEQNPKQKNELEERIFAFVKTEGVSPEISGLPGTSPDLKNEDFDI